MGSMAFLLKKKGREGNKRRFSGPKGEQKVGASQHFIKEPINVVRSNDPFLGCALCLVLPPLHSLVKILDTALGSCTKETPLHCHYLGMPPSGGGWGDMLFFRGPLGPPDRNEITSNAFCPQCLPCLIQKKKREGNARCWECRLFVANRPDDAVTITSQVQRTKMMIRKCPQPLSLSLVPSLAELWPLACFEYPHEKTVQQRWQTSVCLGVC